MHIQKKTPFYGFMSKGPSSEAENLIFLTEHQETRILISTSWGEPKTPTEKPLFNYKDDFFFTTCL